MIIWERWLKRPTCPIHNTDLLIIPSSGIYVCVTSKKCILAEGATLEQIYDYIMGD